MSMYLAISQGAPSLAKCDDIIGPFSVHFLLEWLSNNGGKNTQKRNQENKNEIKEGILYLQ